MNFDFDVVQAEDFAEYWQLVEQWSTQGTVEGWHQKMMKAAMLQIG